MTRVAENSPQRAGNGLDEPRERRRVGAPLPGPAAVSRRHAARPGGGCRPRRGSRRGGLTDRRLRRGPAVGSHPSAAPVRVGRLHPFEHREAACRARPGVGLGARRAGARPRREGHPHRARATRSCATRPTPTAPARRSGTTASWIRPVRRVGPLLALGAARRRALAPTGDRRVDRSGLPHDVRAARRPRGGPSRGAPAARRRRPATCRARSGRSARRGSSSRSGTRPTSSCSCARRTSASRRRRWCSPTPLQHALLGPLVAARAPLGQHRPAASAGGGPGQSSPPSTRGSGSPTGTAAMWPLFALYGCYMAATDGVARALVADLSPTGAASDGAGDVPPPDRRRRGDRQHRRRHPLVERRARRRVRPGRRCRARGLVLLTAWGRPTSAH